VAGLSGEDVSTSVIARPPLKLLLLEADAVRVRSGPGSWRGLRFGSLDVTVDVARLGSPPGDVRGRIDAVEFADATGATVRASSIELSGVASTPDVRVALALDDVSALVGRALLPAGLGGPDARIALAPPNGVRIVTPAGESTARIASRADGGLDLLFAAPGVPSVTLSLLEPGAALPVRILGVSVDGDSLVLRGTVDARSLGL
jgi:hypothetical protein